MARAALSVSILSILLSAQAAFASSFNFQGVSDQDYSKIVDDLSASFTHTSVSGASALGHVFGFEVGLVAGSTKTPNINRIVKQSDPDASVPNLPMAEVLGVLTVPFGITGEIGLVPKVGSADFHFNSMSLAAKWTASELLELPFSLAAKGQITTYKIDSSGEVSGVPTTYNYKSTITGLSVLASKDFMIVEPYVGLGILSSKGDMDVTGTPAFGTFGTSASAKRSSTEFMLGAEVKLLVVKIGAEYAHLFGTDRVAGKLSFFF